MPFGAIIGAGLGVGGSLIGAAINRGAAADATQAGVRAANNALGLQTQIFNQTSAGLAPFGAAGTAANAALQTGLGTYQGGFNPNAPLLKSATSALGPPPAFPTLPSFSPTGFQTSPGYQFALSQGEQAAENLATKSQGTIGGNTLKALSTFGTGLGEQDYYNWLQQVYTPTFQSQFQNTLLPYQANTQNYWGLLNAYGQAQADQYNRLLGFAGTGQNAAAGLGTLGQNFANSAAQNITGAGNFIAGGALTGANAVTGGINSAIGNLLGPNVGSGSGLGNALASLLNPPPSGPGSTTFPANYYQGAFNYTDPSGGTFSSAGF